MGDSFTRDFDPLDLEAAQNRIRNSHSAQPSENAPEGRKNRVTGKEDRQCHETGHRRPYNPKEDERPEEKVVFWDMPIIPYQVQAPGVFSLADPRCRQRGSAGASVNAV